MKNTIILLLLTTIITLFNTSCEENNHLDGVWEAAGNIGGEDIDSQFSWYLEYTFKGNSYELNGYPPINENGSLEYLEVKENKYTIKITPSNSEPEIITVLKFGDDSLTFSGNTFYQVHKVTE